MIIQDILVIGVRIFKSFQKPFKRFSASQIWIKMIEKYEKTKKRNKTSKRLLF